MTVSPYIAIYSYQKGLLPLPIVLSNYVIHMVRKTDTLFYLSKGRHAAFPSRPSRPPRRLGQTEASPRTKPRRRCGWRRLGRKNARGSEREGRGVAKREILSIYKYATRKSKRSASSFVTSQKKSNDNEKSSQPRAQRTRHHLPPSAMSKKKSGAVRRSKKRAAATNPFTGLPLDVVLTHILRTDRLPDPIDLARLRAVCRGMRDAVAATGREIQEHDGASAAKAGCLSTMQHLQRRGRLPFLKRAGNPETAYLCGSAAEGRQLEVMQWLRANDCPWGRNTCSNAAYGGHLEVLQWAHEHGCPWDESTCSGAARKGHLEVLQWARANGCPWDEKTCAAAAQEGHLVMLQWARVNGCLMDRWTCANAALIGDLEILQWARDNNCPWSGTTCSQAAASGHLEVLMWAHENDCPWDLDTCLLAYVNGHVEVLNWLRANGCPG